MEEQTITRAQQIRTMLAEGMKPRQVAEKLGIKPQYVYDIRSKAGLTKRVKRRAKPVAVKPKQEVVAQTADQSKVDSMRRYIMHLETELLMKDGAINALRNKLYGAAV